MKIVLLLALIVVIFLLIYWFSSSSERLGNASFYNSNLEDDMDYIKDNKGYTLNDYILYDHSISGKGIDSPF